MNWRERRRLPGAVLAGLFLFAVCLGVMALAFNFFRSRSEPSDAIVGRVEGPDGPIADATVRWQATNTQTATDADGRFQLTRIAGSALRLTASHPGFFIGSTDNLDEPLIRLEPLPDDDPNYAWQDPSPSLQSHACANCHESIYEQWSAGGHASSASNRRFLDLHQGRRADGEKGGWSLADQHPLGRGVCFACHAPTAADQAVAAGDFDQLNGVAKLGVHCDFCHKIEDVAVPELGLTHGRDAFTLRRPPGDKQLFFGPFDDVDRGEDVHSPLLSESQYCAACHEGVVFGTPVYTTYSEWLKSAAAEAGKSCQSCHMPADGKTKFATDGLHRDPHTLSTHGMMPGGKLAMLKQAVTVQPRLTESMLSISLKTQDVGHRVPTGYIDRHLLLVISEPDGGSIAKRVVAGERLPPFVGETFAGQAGRLFARVIRDSKGQAPAPFWDSFDDPEDTRLSPDSSLELMWRFSAPPDKLRVRLLYRRFWETVRVDKGWEDDTLVVFDRVIEAADAKR